MPHRLALLMNQNQKFRNIPRLGERRKEEKKRNDETFLATLLEISIYGLPMEKIDDLLISEIKFQHGAR